MVTEQCYRFVTFLFLSTILTEHYHQGYALRKFNKREEHDSYLKLLNHLLDDNRKGKSKSTNRISSMKNSLNTLINEDFDKNSADERLDNDKVTHVFVLNDLKEDFRNVDNFVWTKNFVDDSDSTDKQAARTIYDSGPDNSDAKSEENQGKGNVKQSNEDEEDCNTSELMSSQEGNGDKKSKTTGGKGVARSCSRPKSRCKKACYYTYRSTLRAMSFVTHSTFCSLFLLVIVKGITGSLLRTRLRHLDPYYDDLLGNGDEERIIVIALIDDDTNSIGAYKNLILRTNENEKPTVELKSQIPHTDTLQGEPQKKQDKGDFDGLKLTRQQKSMLRKKWRASCDRKAAKTCRKACKMAALMSVARTIAKRVYVDGLRENARKVANRSL
ncbi:unnamed protein product, partial [Iphiclides podalirius]